MNELKAKGINKKKKDVGACQELSIPRLPLAVSLHWGRPWKVLEEMLQGDKELCDVSFVVKFNTILVHYLALVVSNIYTII